MQRMKYARKGSTTKLCTFHDEQTVMVCDVAIGQVRERLQEAFGEAVQYTTVDGKGTLVQAASSVDTVQFQALTRDAIARVQAPSQSQEK